MAFSCFPDIFSWIENLPPILQWKSQSISLHLCPSNSLQPSLKLSLNNFKNSSLSLSIFADYNLPILLWTSKNIAAKSGIEISRLITQDGDTIYALLTNFIESILKYSPSKCPSFLKLPKTQNIRNLKDIFNFTFLTLTFVVCVYEAPNDLRSACLESLKDQLSRPKSRGVSRDLMRMLGSNAEELWMRSVNLAITNWIAELQAAHVGFQPPSAMFSYSVSTLGLWKVQLYCPVIAVDVEKRSDPSPDERLLFSLNYHQLEGVIQLNYKVRIQEKWIEIMVNTDNIRCDVIKLLTDTLMEERGAGKSEKHFPSRIALLITPTTQSSVISISVGKSSDNPQREIGMEKALEASFEPLNTNIGLNFSSAETTVLTLKPWKFEQSVWGNSAKLNWFLHDSGDGREVFSSKPSKFAMLQPRAWFKNRYSSAHRPFTREGGVVFAGDEYGESVSWKVDRGCMGRSMEWEIKGWIWLTYWPNKHRSFYSETRRFEFREILDLTLL